MPDVADVLCGDDCPDLVLVNLPLHRDAPRSGYQRSVPPLGLGYIATYVRSLGIRVAVLDAELHGMSDAAVVDRLAQVRPPVIGVNCYTPAVTHCIDLLSRLTPHAQRLLVGGPHVTARPEDFAHLPNVTAVVGFGERIAAEVARTPDRPGFEVLTDRLLGPDIADLFVDQSFFANVIIEHEGKREGVLVSSRGCPYSCRYCMSANSPYSIRPLASTMDTITDLVLTHGAESIHFLDDIIFPSTRHVAAFVEAQRARDLLGAFTWRGLLSIGVLRKMDVDALAKSMCRGISIGVESGSARLLRLVGKRYTAVDVDIVLARLDATPIRVKLFLMVGLPTETESDREATRALVAHAARHRCVADINVFQYKPYPGTSLYDDLFADVEVEFFHDDLRVTNAPRITSNKMSEAVAKDTFFCRHALLDLSIDSLQEYIMDVYETFYSHREERECVKLA